MHEKDDTPNIEVIYDSECPICNQFACSIGDADNVTLVDGRKPSTLFDESQRLNLDIDRGSVVHVDGKFLYGADAFQLVATHVEGKGLFGILSRTLFRHRFIAKITYPAFVFVRRLLLKRLGKSLINERKVLSPE